MIEIRHLQNALALAEHHNFAKAGAAMGISQPALTRSIQSLERQLGIELFDRSRRIVEPTEAGGLFLEKARQVVQCGEELEQAIGMIRCSDQVELVVSAGAYAAELVLGAAVARLIASRPDIRLRIHVVDWQAGIREVRSRDAHFCLAELSPLQGDPDLLLRPLKQHTGYVVVRAGHPLATHNQVALAQAFKYPMVASTTFPPRLLQRLSGFRKGCGGSGPLLPEISCDYLSVVRKILTESNCFGLFTLPQVEAEVRGGSLVALPCDQPWMHTAYGIIQLKSRKLCAEAERFIQLLKEVDDEVAELEARLVAELLPTASRSPAMAAESE